MSDIDLRLVFVVAAVAFALTALAMPSRGAAPAGFAVAAGLALVAAAVSDHGRRRP